MDLQSAADQLYALEPQELASFATRRGELVAQARSAGDRELAKQIGALRKPVQAAALVNALVRSTPAELTELAGLGHRLREAHRHLRGEELRELSEQRQRLLGRLVRIAGEGAGRPVAESVLAQVRATFEAAIADEAAEAAVRTGQLTSALSYSGFGEIDLSEAVAVPRRLTAVPDLPTAAAGEPTINEPTINERAIKKTAEKHADRAARKQAERALQKAESAVKDADRGVTDAAERLRQAEADEAEVKRRIGELQSELAEARDRAGRVEHTKQAAERDHDCARRAAERAEQARQLARADLKRITKE